MLDRMNLYRPVIYGLLVFSALITGASYFFVDTKLFLILALLWALMALWALLCCARIARNTDRQLMALRGTEPENGRTYTALPPENAGKTTY